MLLRNRLSGSYLSFVATKRAEGCGVDVRVLMLLAGNFLAGE